MALGQGKGAALVRIAAGLIFVAEGWGKVSGRFVRGGFAEQARDIARGAWPVWRSFLRSAVVPNAGAVAWLVALGELAVGVALILGFLTRWACSGGALLLVSFLLGQFWTPGRPWDQWVTAGVTTKFALLLMILLAVADTGRVWGLDGRVGKRRRRRGVALT